MTRSSLLQKASVATALCSTVLLAACGSGSGDSVGGGMDGNSAPGTSTENSLPTGNITSFGAITVADDAGEVSDIIASFYRFENPVAESALLDFFDATQPRCIVEDNEVVAFSDISVSFFPDFAETAGAVSAGETIVLTDTAGTYATLQRQGLGEFQFYSVDDMMAVPPGAVPASLNAVISGQEFPAFTAQTFPVQTTLENFTYSGSAAIGVDTQFTWDISTQPNSMIRIVSSTAGGFFLENSSKVSCLVPDNASFQFPPNIRTALGADFIGGSPIVSRVTVDTVIENNAALFLVRESFADQ